MHQRSQSFVSFSNQIQINKPIIPSDFMLLNSTISPQQNMLCTNEKNYEKSNFFNASQNYDLDCSKFNQQHLQQSQYYSQKTISYQKEYFNLKKVDLNSNFQLLSLLKKGKNLVVGDIITVLSDFQNYQQSRFFKAYNSERIIENSKFSYEKDGYQKPKNAQTIKDLSEESKNDPDLIFNIANNVLTLDINDEKNKLIKVYFKVYSCNEIENKQLIYQNAQYSKLKESIYIIVEITESKNLPSNMIDVKHFEFFKKKILSSVSHELKTPLNCSIQLLEILQNSDMLQENQKKMFITPTLNSNHLLMFMINDIIDFAQIADGNLNLTFAPFNIVDTIRDCLSYFTIQAAFKNITIDFNFDQQIPEVINSDPMRLKQVVINLINNAMKFTNKGLISVCVDLEDKDLIKISIQDTGCGIPSQLGSKIFKGVDDYMGQSKQFNTKGAGLGLTISNNIAMGLGGNRKIEYKSQVDEGSIFTFFVLNRPMKVSGCKINHINLFNRSYYQWISFSSLSKEYQSKKSYDKDSSLKSKYSLRYSSNQFSENISQRDFYISPNIISSNSEYSKNQNQYKKQITSFHQILNPDNISLSQNESQHIFRKESEIYTQEEDNALACSQSDTRINFNKGRDVDLGLNSVLPMKTQSKMSNLVTDYEDKQPSIQSQIKQHLQTNFEDEPCNIPSENSIQQKTQKRINQNYFNVAHRKNQNQNLENQDAEKSQVNTTRRIKDSQLDILQSEIQSFISSTSQNNISPKKITKKPDERGPRFSMQVFSQRMFTQEYQQNRRLSYNKEEAYKKTKTDFNLIQQNKIYNKNIKKMSTINEETLTNISKNQLNRNKTQVETLNNAQSSANNTIISINNSISTIKNCICPKILIVDDNTFNLYALELRLKEYHYDVDKANSGMEAIEKVKIRYNNRFKCCKEYKLIFMDIDMPQMNGYETTFEILKFFKEKNEKCCPISACTAYVQEEEKIKAFNAGMSFYLTKPVLSEKLSNILISANL